VSYRPPPSKDLLQIIPNNTWSSFLPYRLPQLSQNALYGGLCATVRGAPISPPIPGARFLFFVRNRDPSGGMAVIFFRFLRIIDYYSSPLCALRSKILCASIYPNPFPPLLACPGFSFFFTSSLFFFDFLSRSSLYPWRWRS